MSFPKFSVIIPVRNEQKTLEIALKVLLSVGIGVIHEAIVVVDDPNDLSLLIQEEFKLEKRVVFAINNREKGVFSAINHGVEIASSDYIIIFVADEILPILQIQEFAVAMKVNDFVSATRYAKGGQRLGGNKVGKYISFAVNKFYAIKTRGKITDATTGLKAFKKEKWDLISKDANQAGWACAFRFSLNAHEANLVRTEIPIVSVDRPIDGKSTFKLFSWIRGYLKAAKFN